MRTVSLSKAALQYEIVLLKARALRTARSAAFMAVAGVLGLFALALLHVALFFVFELDAHITPAWSVVIVAGIDVVLALLLVVIGRVGGPGPIEIEARIMRDRSLADLRNAFALAAVTGPAGRLAGRGALNVVRRMFSRRRV